jgi:hypothetical protein
VSGALHQPTVGVVEIGSFVELDELNKPSSKLSNTHAERWKDIFVEQGTVRGPQQHVLENVAVEPVHEDPARPVLAGSRCIS